MTPGSTGSAPSHTGQPVGEQVDPQDLGGEQRQRQAHERPDEHDEDFRRPTCQGVQQKATDVGIDAAAFLNRRDDGTEVVVREDQICCLTGHFGASPPHRHTDVGLPESGAVVDAVPRHGHHMPRAMPCPDDVQLLSWTGACIHP